MDEQPTGDAVLSTDLLALPEGHGQQHALLEYPAFLPPIEQSGT
jgi:hypothetical protein